jgi:hypothetical protein
MCERLPNRYALTIDGYANEPVASPPEIGYRRLLELGVAIGTNHQYVIGMMAQRWVKVVYLKVGFTISFFESKGAELAFPVM